MEEVETLSALRDAAINSAKETLAYEVTKLVHGAAEAGKARDAARALFADGGDPDQIPTTVLGADVFKGEGVGLANLIREIGLAQSNSEGFRVIEQGGLFVNGEKISDKKFMVTTELFRDGSILIKKGKKAFHRVMLETV
jgi:tyrosyl-tRNA synthetase